MKTYSTLVKAVANMLKMQMMNVSSDRLSSSRTNTLLALSADSRWPPGHLTSLTSFFVKVIIEKYLMEDFHDEHHRILNIHLETNSQRKYTNMI